MSAAPSRAAGSFPLPEVVSPSEWRAAVEALRVKEKEATRAQDALAAQRRRLPMVRVDEEYVFEAPGGPVTVGTAGGLGGLARRLAAGAAVWLDASSRPLRRPRRVIRLGDVEGGGRGGIDA